MYLYIPHVDIPKMTSEGLVVPSFYPLSPITGLPLGDHVPFTMIGVMKVKLVQISAILGGTKLIGDIQNVTASVTYKEIVRGQASCVFIFLCMLQQQALSQIE